jgi:hypothetical protein
VSLPAVMLLSEATGGFRGTVTQRRIRERHCQRTCVCVCVRVCVCVDRSE